MGLLFYNQMFIVYIFDLHLTRWGQNKMVAFSQMIFSNAFLWNDFGLSKSKILSLALKTLNAGSHLVKGFYAQTIKLTWNEG